MPSLYELTGEYKKLLEFGGECDLEDPEDAQAFLDTLEGLKGELDMKVDNCAAIIRELEAESEKFDKEADYYQKRATAMYNAAMRLKEYVKNELEAVNLQEIRGERFIVKVQKSGGKRALHITGDVPDNYQKIVYEPDKDKIRKALEDGEELPFAELAERGTFLKIK